MNRFLTIIFSSIISFMGMVSIAYADIIYKSNDVHVTCSQANQNMQTGAFILNGCIQSAGDSHVFSRFRSGKIVEFKKLSPRDLGGCINSTNCTPIMDVMSKPISATTKDDFVAVLSSQTGFSFHLYGKGAKNRDGCVVIHESYPSGGLWSNGTHELCSNNSRIRLVYTAGDKGLGVPESQQTCTKGIMSRSLRAKHNNADPWRDNCLSIK